MHLGSEFIDPMVEVANLLCWQSKREFSLVNKAFNKAVQLTNQPIHHTINNRYDLLEYTDSPFYQKNQERITLTLKYPDLTEPELKYALRTFENLCVDITQGKYIQDIARIFKELNRQVRIHAVVSQKEQLLDLAPFDSIGVLTYDAGEVNADLATMLDWSKVTTLKATKVTDLTGINPKELEIPKIKNNWHLSFMRPNFVKIMGTYDFSELRTLFFYRKYLKSIELSLDGNTNIQYILDLGIPIAKLFLTQCTSKETVKLFCGPQRLCSNVEFNYGCNLTIDESENFEKILIDNRTTITFTAPVFIQYLEIWIRSPQWEFVMPMGTINDVKVWFMKKIDLDFTESHIANSVSLLAWDPIEIRLWGCDSPLIQYNSKIKQLEIIGQVGGQVKLSSDGNETKIVSDRAWHLGLEKISWFE
jgi:hypothetical protein